MVDEKEKELSPSEEVARLAAIVESSDDAIIGKTLDGTITSWNEGASRLYGYSAEEAIGQAIYLVVPQDRHGEVVEILEKIRDGKRVDHFETERMTKAGKMVVVSLTISPIRDGAGETVGASVIGRDISARKQAEKELKSHREKLEKLVRERTGALQETNKQLREGQKRLKEAEAMAHLGHWDLDLTTNSLYWSDEIYRIFEIDPDKFGASYESFLETIHPEDRELVNMAYTESVKDRTQYDISHRLLFRDGKEKFVNERCYTEYDEEGKPVRSIGTVQDITEQKKAEDEINKLNEELEERVRQRTAELEAANTELEAFAYSVSHDLRSPLRSIDGFSQAVLEDYADKMDEEGQHYLRRVRAGSQRMGKLIDDILQLSRTTRRVMKREPVDLSEMALIVAEELRETDPGRNVKFTIVEGAEVTGDAHLLRVMLENLLGNAWKYSGGKEKAEIEFGVKKEDGATIYFIRDNGAGFEMKYADKLFVPFQRLHSDAEFAGSGVGLANVQRIIRRHGGRVWAEGEPEKGAVFYFTLQRRP